MEFREKIYSEGIVIQCIDINYWDFTNYSEWMSSKTQNRYIESINQDWGVAKLIDYVKSINYSEDEIIVAISDNRTLSHVGNMKFSNIDSVAKSASVGVLIGDVDYRGKGIFKQSFIATAQYLCKKFGINSFYLGVNPSNVSAVKSYLKTGFRIINVSEFKYEMKFDLICNS